MPVNTKQFLDNILKNLEHMDHIKSADIPNISLYMDQVTTFMDAHLADQKRFKHDKILTKTMINNYAKNNLLPPPEKKKYSREHMLVMLFIYYFKAFLSITDIQAILNPLTEKYFQSDAGFNLESVYNEVFLLEKEQIDRLKGNILEMYDTSEKTFSDAAPEDREFLQQFSFICLLSFDVYMKKQIIERLIDQSLQNEDEKNK